VGGGLKLLKTAGNIAPTHAASPFGLTSTNFAACYS
jgi:hypothetical protein